MKQAITTLFLATTIALVLVCEEAQAQAPFGWRTFDHKGTAIRLYHPKEFSVTPAQPTEKLVIGKWTRKKAYKLKKRERRRPESFQVFVLNDRSTPSGNQESPSKEKPKPVGKTDTNAGGEKVPIPKKGPKNYDEVIAARNDASTWKEFVKKRFVNMSHERTKTKLKEHEEEYRLQQHGRYVGYIFVRRSRGQTWGVIGFCSDKVAKTMQKRFRDIARSMHRPRGYTKVRDDSEDFYKNKDFRDIAFRVNARREMVKGWKALDTKNFFIVYNTKNLGLVNRIANDLEAVRPYYETMFPPVKAIDAVSVVRVCQNSKVYSEYGGPRGSAGYWNFVAKELVLFDAKGTIRKTTKRIGPKRKASDSLVVLYHEAFHQYIFYALGSNSPDYWFNEGMADYFAGAKFYRGSKKMKEIALNSWRLPLLKKIVSSAKFIPLERLITAKRAQFYNPLQASRMYAEAWSLTYFMLKSKPSKNRPDWQEVIPKYYDYFKSEAAKIGKTFSASTTLHEKNSAMDRARERATKKAFENIDREELEREWKKWLVKIKNPFPSRR